MLNQEINSLTFNPDIKRGEPKDVIIIIGFEKKNGVYFTHTILPDDRKIATAMLECAIKSTKVGGE